MTDRKKILILDDEQEILELLERILEGQYHVFTKRDTTDFEQELQRIRPDVILIDHFIGDKTSNEVIQKSLKVVSNIPVILHSAHEEIEKISIDANVAGYIRKPCGIKEIRDCIASILNKTPATEGI